MRSHEPPIVEVSLLDARLSPERFSAWIAYFEHWQEETLMSTLSHPPVQKAIGKLRAMSADEENPSQSNSSKTLAKRCSTSVPPPTLRLGSPRTQHPSRMPEQTVQPHWTFNLKNGLWVKVPADLCLVMNSTCV